MSYWTYVNGVIKVKTFANTNSTVDYIVSKTLENLPPVTGSGINMSAIPINNGENNSFINADEFFNQLDPDKSRETAYNSNRTIIVDGALRDRVFDETLKEFTNWLTRLSNRIIVSYILVEVNSNYESYVFNDASKLRDMYEPIWSHELMNRTLFNNYGKSTRALYYQGYDLDYKDNPILYNSDQRIYIINRDNKTFDKLDEYDICFPKSDEED